MIEEDRSGKSPHFPYHVMICYIINDWGEVLLQKKARGFGVGKWNGPGGKLQAGETPEEACLREVKEETNLDIKIEAKIGVYDEPGRDPRGEVHSTVYKCSIRAGKDKMSSGDDSEEVMLISKEKLKELKLAFDHKKMLEDAGYF